MLCPLKRISVPKHVHRPVRDTGFLILYVIICKNTGFLIFWVRTADTTGLQHLICMADASALNLITESISLAAPPGVLLAQEGGKAKCVLGSRMFILFLNEVTSGENPTGFAACVVSHFCFTPDWLLQHLSAGRQDFATKMQREKSLDGQFLEPLHDP